MSSSHPALNPPPHVRAIAERLESAGFETWCVGGAVRDALLGHPHLDWDLATAARPEQVRQLFRRTVPIGIEFGTIGVLDTEGTMHEVTTFRRDVRTDGRHAVVEFGASLEDDLARRDYTINAIAYSPAGDELRDPFGGRDDLRAKVLRAVGDPAARMREDRLRALRGIRFAARFGFTIDPATWRAIVESAPELGSLSAERVKQELEKTMDQVERPSAALRMWRDSGALATLVPSLASTDDVTLASLDRLARPGSSTRPQRRLNRVAALFTGVPAAETERALRALRFSNQDSAWIAALVRGRQAIASELDATVGARREPTAAQLRRWAARVGRMHLLPVLRVDMARRDDAGREWCALYGRAARSVFRDALVVGDLSVDGEDLTGAGIPAGRMMGLVLRALLELVLDDPSLNERDMLLAKARELADRFAREAQREPQ
ncbi:MAG: CCA tRNA nucleotidyltransferase [Gemmatimonadota bacterium]|nr:CCA tRNA nucleotidyltransferase [Gemmatimonadota bacterium]